MCKSTENLFFFYGISVNNLSLCRQVPLELDVRSSSDEGKPIVLSSPQSISAKAYVDIAEKIVNRLKELEEERKMGPHILL